MEAFALEGEFEVTALRSNAFEIEWPPRGGERHAFFFPEVDRVAWFPLDEAHRMILPGQRPLLGRLEALAQVGVRASSSTSV